MRDAGLRRALFVNRVVTQGDGPQHLEHCGLELLEVRSCPGEFDPTSLRLRALEVGLGLGVQRGELGVFHARPCSKRNAGRSSFVVIDGYW